MVKISHQTWCYPSMRCSSSFIVITTLTLHLVFSYLMRLHIAIQPFAKRVREIAQTTLNVKAHLCADSQIVQIALWQTVAQKRVTLTLIATTKNATPMWINVVWIRTALTGQSAARIHHAGTERAIVMNILIARDLFYVAITIVMDKHPWIAAKNMTVTWTGSIFLYHSRIFIERL